MAQHFQIKPNKDEIPMLVMLLKQDTYRAGLEKFLLRYEEETKVVLNNLNNDHEKDLMCKTIIKTIEYIRKMPYELISEDNKKEVVEE